MATSDPTALWVCHSLAFAICLLRLALRLWRGQKYNTGDLWTVVAAIFIALRVSFNHVILLTGTTTSMLFGLQSHPPIETNHKEHSFIRSGTSKSR